MCLQGVSEPVRMAQSMSCVTQFLVLLKFYENCLVIYKNLNCFYTRFQNYATYPKNSLTDV